MIDQDLGDVANDMQPASVVLLAELFCLACGFTGIDW